MIWNTSAYWIRSMLAMMILSLLACSEGGKTAESSTDDSDTLFLTRLVDTAWVHISESKDTLWIADESDTLKLWWGRGEDVNQDQKIDQVVRMQATAGFAGDSLELQYVSGAEYQKVFAAPVLQEEATSTIIVNTQSAKVDFGLRFAMAGGRVLILQPINSIAFLYQVSFGEGESSSSSSQASSSSSAVTLTAGKWGANYTSADTAVKVVLELLADQTFMETETRNWTLPSAGCAKVEYSGTWRQDAWILALDRTTLRTYTSCALGLVSAPSAITEEPLSISMEFMDATGEEIYVQWPFATLGITFYTMN